MPNTLELADQLEDLLNNFTCPCLKTEHCPCPRCQVSIQQSKELLQMCQEYDGWVSTNDPVESILDALDHIQQAG